MAPDLLTVSTRATVVVLLVATAVRLAGSGLFGTLSGVRASVGTLRRPRPG